MFPWSGHVPMELAVRYERYRFVAWATCADDFAMRDLLDCASHPVVQPHIDRPSSYPDSAFCTPLTSFGLRASGCSPNRCKPCCDMFRCIVQDPPTLADLLDAAAKRRP